MANLKDFMSDPEVKKLVGQAKSLSGAMFKTKDSVNWEKLNDRFGQLLMQLEKKTGMKFGEIHRQLSTVQAAAKRKLVKASLDDDRTLIQLIDMAAESGAYEEPAGGWKVTKEIEREVTKFERELQKALDQWTKKRPLKGMFTTDTLMDANGGFLVFMTLRGEGVGIWDGDWDEFFEDPKKDIKDLEKFLEQKLRKYADHTGGGSLNIAIDNAAYEQAYGAEAATKRKRAVAARQFFVVVADGDPNESYAGESLEEALDAAMFDSGTRYTVYKVMASDAGDARMPYSWKKGKVVKKATASTRKRQRKHHASFQRAGNRAVAGKGYRIEVIDTLNDRTVQDRRADNPKKDFAAMLKKYDDHKRYTVQLIENESDEIVKDNGGIGGKIRSFSKSSFKGAVPGNLGQNTKPSTPDSQMQAVELLKQGGILPEDQKPEDYPVLTAQVKREIIATLLKRKQPKLATWASRNLVTARKRVTAAKWFVLEQMHLGGFPSVFTGKSLDDVVRQAADAGMEDYHNANVQTVDAPNAAEAVKMIEGGLGDFVDEGKVKRARKKVGASTRKRRPVQAAKNYVSIVFLQNDFDFNDFNGSGGRGQSGFFDSDEKEMVEFLKQWEGYGDYGEVVDPMQLKGSRDYVYKKGRYLMTYNPGLGYAGLYAKA